MRTRSGKIVIIETKGDHLANEATLDKLHLDRAWQQEQAGPGYRYFLVFQDKDISMIGAHPMSEFSLELPIPRFATSSQLFFRSGIPHHRGSAQTFTAVHISRRSYQNAAGL